MEILAVETYRSRWIVCEDCGCVTIIENRDSENGVPDPVDWDQFGTCLVCGSSQHNWNADEKTVDDQSWAKGRAHGRKVGLREAAQAVTDMMFLHDPLEWPRLLLELAEKDG